MSSPTLTRRQRDIVEFFREYRQRTGISPTLEEIAQHFDVNKVTIFGHVAELERKGVLMRRTPRASRALELVDPSETARNEWMVPLLGSIAAGRPIDVVVGDEAVDLSEMLPRGRDVYALRVRGQSMIEDCICDGDLVLVEKRETARNGEIVVAVLPDETATLKRFYREDGRIRLQPANSAMEPIWLDAVEIRGVVVGLVRSVG
jgi:repressor LexA